MEKKVFSPEQIEKIKKENKCNVIHIKVYLDEAQQEVRECIIKDPLDMDDLTFVSAALNKDDSIKRGEFILDSLWIDGHEDFRLQKNSHKCVNTRVRLAACKPANEALSMLKAEIAKS